MHVRRTGGGEVDGLEEYHAKRGARGGREVAEAGAVPFRIFFPARRGGWPGLYTGDEGGGLFLVWGDVQWAYFHTLSILGDTVGFGTGPYLNSRHSDSFRRAVSSASPSLVII